MKIRLYSYNMLTSLDMESLGLPDDIRSNFELPAWPYTDNPEHYQLFIDYLTKLTVFWYEDDSVNGDGVGVDPIVLHNHLQHASKEGGLCFHYTVYVDDNTFRVKQFPLSMLNKDKGLKQLSEAKGDTNAWLDFDIPGDMSELKDDGRHIFKKRTEYLKPCENQCDKLEKVFSGIRIRKP